MKDRDKCNAMLFKSNELLKTLLKEKGREPLSHFSLAKLILTCTCEWFCISLKHGVVTFLLVVDTV